MPTDHFGARHSLAVGDRSYEIRRLDSLESVGDVGRLPYSLKILLENLLRHCGNGDVSEDDVVALAGWSPHGDRTREVSFIPARVLLQDFTGVPAVVDLAAMRDAMHDMGGDASRINPLCPAELVIDHSVIVDSYGSPLSFQRNAELEFHRNLERYAFLRWGQGALSRFRVVPPDTGIVHQVNLEHLARVVFVDESGAAYPDTLVGTDSHTTMVNGLGVLGWGVGGIEAEAALLGQPVAMLTPSVVGFRLSGKLPPGTTATDLVLTVTNMLRHHGVVGCFVEFYGPGLSGLPLADRATIGNMSPEYGSTCAIFPIDDVTLRYLELTGRPAEQVRLVEAYAKEQGLFHRDGDDEALYTDTLSLDLSTVEPCIAGPARPQDRIPLSHAAGRFRSELASFLGDGPHSPHNGNDEASEESFPASDPPSAMAGVTGKCQPEDDGDDVAADPGPLTAAAVSVSLPGRGEVSLDHGHVVIAAITSCTNTSNPALMVAAGLLARKAVARGLRSKPWVKTSLAPGSRVVMDYYRRSGLVDDLDALGFNLVGFGCTTCIGNSGPLLPEISAAVRDNDLSVCSVLSGNRNFEGRINPDCRMNFLASPPLVVAYALAGSMAVNLTSDPLGSDDKGEPVYLRDIWPTADEVAEVVGTSVEPEMFRDAYSAVFEGDDRWRSLEVPEGELFSWDDASTYVRLPPYFEGMGSEPEPLADIEGARVLALLGDSVTTDHISPAGVIAPDGPAGSYLRSLGVAPEDFNSYGSRRGNHEVMVRGTFANIRLRNQLAPGTEGGFTAHLPDGEVTTIYDAALRYQAEGVPLIVVAGEEYGSGSSRDWAAKGTALLGVKAVLARSFERIHRSNLVGMGVLPLQFRPGESLETLGLSGREEFSVTGLGASPGVPSEVRVSADGVDFTAIVRVDSPKEAEYVRHGGILRYVLRQMLKEGS
jgi:aconitate hydratase